MAHRSALVIAAGIAAAALVFFVLRDSDGPPASAGPTQAEPLANHVELPPRDAPRERLEPRPAGGPSGATPVPAPAAKDASASPTLEIAILVTRDDGQPLRNARFNLGTSAAEIRSFRTDAAGVVRIPAPSERRVRFTLIPNGGLPVSGTVSLDDPAPRISVPTGSRVAGVLTVHGAVPKEPIPLMLDGEGLTVETDAEGRFEFFNLRPNYKGAVSFPEYYRLASEDEDAAPGKPRIAAAVSPDDLHIRLAERPAIRGRIVRPGPTPTRGTVSALLTPGDGNRKSSFSNEDGWFCVLVPKNLDLAVLRVTDFSGIGARDLQVRGPIQGVKNLGDVAIGGARQLELIVRDAAGRPVEGARATIGDTGSWSPPTDARGVATISVESGASPMRVGKLGYAVAEITVAETTRGALNVTLQPGNTLTVDIELGDKLLKPRHAVRVGLTCPGAMFSGPRNWMDPILSSTGGNGPGSMNTQRYGTMITDSKAECSPDESGKVIAAGFKPGVELTVRLLALRTDEVLDEQHVVMGAADSRAVTLRSAARPKDLDGIVVTESGEPVVDARVFVNGERMKSARSTNAAGAFTVAGIFGDTVRLDIEKKGFAPLRVDSVRVPPLSPPARFVLTQ